MEQIFFTQKNQIGKEHTPIEKMAGGGTIMPQKPIEKMTILELQEFMQLLDPLKYQTMNWFKGQTRKGLRVQVQKIYDKYLEKKQAEEEEMDYFAGGGKTAERKSPNESATSVQEGTLGIGNDGTFYATVLNKNSIGAWRQVDKTNFNDELTVLSYKQTITGNDKKYDGTSTIEFYSEMLNFRLILRQVSRMKLEIILFFDNHTPQLEEYNKLSETADRVVSSDMVDYLCALVMPQVANNVASDQVITVSTMTAKMMSEGLRKDLILIEKSLINIVQNTLPSLIDVDSKFNRDDLLTQHISSDPFNRAEPIVRDYATETEHVTVEENEPPTLSTDPSTWSLEYKVGDRVKIRRDMVTLSNFSESSDDYYSSKNAFTIVEKRKAHNGVDYSRPENPSGYFYALNNGETWEGKDIELIQKADESVALPLSKKPSKDTRKELTAVIDNVEAPKKTRKELKQDYTDLSFLISITPPTDVITMTELKKQARALKDDIDRLGLIEKDIMLAENHIFDELFQASTIKPKNRYNLTPSLDGFAPDGTPTQLPKKIYDMVHTDEFEDWFGNFQLAYQFQNTAYSDVPCSVVKNEHFEPQIVYHGTGSEFSFFDFSKFPAMYFAENIHYSEWFANLKGGEMGHNGYVYPFFLNIKNPLDLTHFGIRKISKQEFTDWMYLQCGLLPDELKINSALLNPNEKYWAWVYLRNGAEMLQVLRDSKLFDGIVYYEQNPPIEPTAPNYMTKGFIIFESNNAKIVDPERHNVLLASMRSFYLKKGGKL